MIWTKGDDFQDGDKPTYGIHKGDHGNAIEVYSCSEDRDRILKFLQMEEATNDTDRMHQEGIKEE